jgi:hypothetical protein
MGEREIKSHELLKMLFHGDFPRGVVGGCGGLYLGYSGW